MMMMMMMMMMMITMMIGMMMVILSMKIMMVVVIFHKKIKDDFDGDKNSVFDGDGRCGVLTVVSFVAISTVTVITIMMMVSKAIICFVLQESKFTATGKLDFVCKTDFQKPILGKVICGLSERSVKPPLGRKAAEKVAV